MSDLPNLQSSDIRQLGSFYTNDFPVDVEIDSRGARLVASKKASGGIVAMTTILTLIVGAFYSLLGYLVAVGRVEQSLLWMAVLPCIIAIVGPAIGHTVRHRFLQDQSPFVDFESRKRMVTILNGRHCFCVSDIYGLMAATISDGDQYTELQLLVVDDNKLKPYLLRTSIGGSAESEFGRQLREFGEATGIRTVVASPQGFLRNEPFLIREVTPNRVGFPGAWHH